MKVMLQSLPRKKLGQNWFFPLKLQATAFCSYAQTGVVIASTHLWAPWGLGPYSWCLRLKQLAQRWVDSNHSKAFGEWVVSEKLGRLPSLLECCGWAVPRDEGMVWQYGRCVSLSFLLLLFSWVIISWKADTTFRCVVSIARLSELLFHKADKYLDTANLIDLGEPL